MYLEVIGLGVARRPSHLVRSSYGQKVQSSSFVSGCEREVLALSEVSGSSSLACFVSCYGIGAIITGDAAVAVHRPEFLSRVALVRADEVAVQ